MRSEDEFTVRFCFVNFDGDRALRESERVGIDADLAEDFVHEFAPDLHAGVQVYAESPKAS